MALFWKKGFEGAHLAELVEVTGLNRFGLYKEFGGKSGLFGEAFDLYLDEARGSLFPRLGKEPLGLANIRDYFSSMYFEPGYHGCFMIITLTAKHVVKKEALEAAVKFTAETEALYFANLAAARERGEIPPSFDALAASRALLVLDQGLSIYGIINPGREDKDRIVDMVLGSVFPATPSPASGDGHGRQIGR